MNVTSSTLERVKENSHHIETNNPLSIQTNNLVEAASNFINLIPGKTDTSKPTLKEQFVSNLLERTKALQAQAAKVRGAQQNTYEGANNYPTATFNDFNGASCSRGKHSNTISIESTMKELDYLVSSNNELQKKLNLEQDTYCKPYEKDVEMQSQMTTTQGADQEEDSYLGSPLLTDFSGTAETPCYTVKPKKRHIKKLFKIVRYQRDATLA